MTITTARHELPLLAPGQAQKEMFHNEALSRVDALLHPAVETVGATTPPALPTSGRSWILGAAPTGAWAGHAQALACWTDGGWRFQEPVAGLRATIRATRMPVEWDGASWREGEIACARVVIGGKAVLGPQGAAIPAPIGGSVVDAEARATLAAVLATMRTHGLIA